MLQMTSPLFAQERQSLPAVALLRRVPSIFPLRLWVDAGGLMSYGVNQTVMNHLAADYVDRIAKGAEPADLPIEQPTAFELRVNVKTAQALGITFPPDVAAQVTQWFQQ